MKARKLRQRGEWLPIGHRLLGLDEITLDGDFIFCQDKGKWKQCDITRNPGFHGDTVRKSGSNGIYRFTRKIA